MPGEAVPAGQVAQPDWRATLHRAAFLSLKLRVLLLWAADGAHLPRASEAVVPLTPLCRRPSIVISYLFSGLSALTSACCFAELCAE